MSIILMVLLAPPPDLHRRGATVLERKDRPKPDTHVSPHGDLRDPGEELRDRQPLTAGEFHDRPYRATLTTAAGVPAAGDRVAR